MQRNSFVFDVPLLKPLEFIQALVCHAESFSIDMTMIVNRLKDGIHYFGSLVFGTIMMEVFLVIKGALDFFSNIFLFLFCVYYMVQAEKGIIDQVNYFFF